MMPSLLYRVAAVAIGLLSITLVGCGRSQGSRFYLLTSLSNSENQQQPAAPGQELAIGIGPVKLPQHLDRPQIVTRTSRNQVQLAEFDRWAEPLKHNFTHVLAENLALLLSTDRVSLFPWTGSPMLDYQIAVEVTHFAGRPDGNVLLNARWTILSGDGKEVLRRSKSSILEPEGGQDYEAIVSAQSRALAELSREIAAATVDLSHDKISSQ
jgi:uncharacterized lipoprotein YmbA